MIRAEGPLAKAFEVVTTPFATSGPEFKAIAKAAASADTLDQFLRDLRARYPDGAAPSAPPAQPGEPQRSSANFSDKSRHAAMP